MATTSCTDVAKLFVTRLGRMSHTVHMVQEADKFPEVNITVVSFLELFPTAM